MDKAQERYHVVLASDGHTVKQETFTDEERAWARFHATAKAAADTGGRVRLYLQKGNADEWWTLLQERGG